MIHEIFPVGPLQCNCSVIGDEQTREGIVIDPGDDIQNVLQAVSKHGLTVKQIIITHAHIDHVGGAMKLRELTGAPILLNQNDYALLKMLDVQAAWLGMAAPAQGACAGALQHSVRFKTGRRGIARDHHSSSSSSSVSSSSGKRQLYRPSGNGSA